MTHRSIFTFAFSFALVAASAVPAFAHEHGHGHGLDPASFPMKADAFQQKVEARLAKAKAHTEKRIADRKLDANQAKELRDRADARAAQVRAAAAAAEQDGVVTLEEAKTVRAAGGKHGDGGHCEHGDKKS